ncbi:MAG: GxxExxY protein [Bacteroidota bacterium]
MFLHEDITDKIIAAFYKVYNSLGYGFLEKVYENALIHELNIHGLIATGQFPVDVFYQDQKVGVYFADIIVDSKIIVEVKAVESIAREHELQLTNYLKATNIEIGLLLNFGKKPEFKRKIFTNDIK